MARGAFIVIEGLDRSGKTTQTDLLSSRLSKTGLIIDRRKFPGEQNLLLTSQKDYLSLKKNMCVVLRPSAKTTS
jgi:dTMP kinase